MMANKGSEYSIPGYVQRYLKDNGYTVAITPMLNYINRWYRWLRADGDFYEHNKIDAKGHRYRYKRRSVQPARRVCREWASLLLNEDVVITTENESINEWLEGYLDSINFLSQGQDLITRSFALGTGAWALWVSLDPVAGNKVFVRRYDARMVLPLSYDDDGVSECAFVTRAAYGGKLVDQLQMHVKVGDTYFIKTKMWKDEIPFTPEGIITDFNSLSPYPTFSIVSPAIDNTCVDVSPYGESVFHAAIDTLQAVDICFDAIYNEVDMSKMRIFIGDMLIDKQPDGEGGTTVIPFGKDDVIFRKLTSSKEDLIETFAPNLRTEAQLNAYHAAWQTLGDLTGFGIDYFSVNTGRRGLRTATEVSADNSALMRNIHKHENILEDAIASILRAVISCGQSWLDCPAGDPGIININFDDSIITDVQSEKAQSLLEVGRTLNAWEYRVEYYGETEEEAKANVPGIVQAPESYGR